MTFQTVPWAVGGGAENPVESARLLAYVATRSERGVVLPTDCQGRALAVPGGSIRVRPGAVVIPNSKPGAPSQSYLAINPEDHEIAITPTGAGVTRSDLVYVRVKDPQYADEPAPPDVETGPYVTVEVITGVAPTTLTLADAIAQGKAPVGRTGVEICRVDMPASTGTVTQGLITDLRRVAVPRTQRAQRLAIGPVSAESLWDWDPAGSFPDSAGWQIDIPSWATRAIVTAWISGVLFKGNTAGSVTTKVGSISTPAVGWNESVASGFDKGILNASGEIAIPAAMRGTTQTVKVDAAISGSPPAPPYAHDVQANQWTHATVDITFMETVDNEAV